MSPKKLVVPHPGVLLRSLIASLEISTYTAADQLAISRNTLSRVLNERAGISPQMALRLELWLGKRGGSADDWMTRQAAYDLAQAREQGIYGVAPEPFRATR